jgi:DNA invertase Pin-like site-specific DNA recombinase
MAVVKDWPEPVIYADEGISGTKQTRPQLDRLLAAIEAGQIDAVIFASLDRLGRKTRLTLDLVARISKHATLVSCREQFDTATPQGQFAITLFAGLAQLERDMIGERTSAALQERWRRDGNIGRVPFGYQRTDAGVAIDESAAATVRRIFQFARRGLSLRAIASALNVLDVPAPRTGRAWHHSSVRAVLANEDAYRGGQRGASSLHWPPIIRRQRTGSTIQEHAARLGSGAA